jgi:hypothetical protein
MGRGTTRTGNDASTAASTEQGTRRRMIAAKACLSRFLIRFLIRPALERALASGKPACVNVICQTVPR